VKRTLFIEVLLAIAAVALASVGLAGLITRWELDRAFSAYLATLPQPQSGMGMGRSRVLGGAEQTFLATLDRGILVASLVAFVLAVAAALAFAWYLTRPLEKLTGAARAIADGELDHRVAVGGPAEIATLAASFNDMADALVEVESLRGRMVGDVAHELRNPLAAIRAQLEGVTDGVLEPTPDRIASIEADVRYLGRIVDDLQELSAAEAGQLTYERERLDLAALARRGAEAAALRAPAGVAVSVEASGPAWIVGDDQRLTQALRNLLDNALRHTKAGSVTVRVDAAAGAVTLDVLDTGEGIPAADLPYIFERFYRADAARSRDSGGSGIGLALVRRIVEDHGGTVHAGNREGGGAVVGFALPEAELS
jgi:two-component system sensor histidine kinase BaeS